MEDRIDASKYDLGGCPKMVIFALFDPAKNFSFPNSLLIC